MGQIQIFPAPKVFALTGAGVPKPVRLSLRADEEITWEFNKRRILWAELLGVGGAGAPLPLAVRLDGGLHPEGYTLDILPGGITLCCGGAPGAFYGMGTLRQVFGQAIGDMVPCLHVEDAPVLDLRGILVDIGRGKIPTMETLRALIDKFAAMKINHMQLYMDGYCFEWQAYKYLFTDETPLTPAEMYSLVQYAAARFIDLVPNLNSLGHMEHWLAKPQFRRFAECEDGFDFQGLYHRAPGTIDPQNEDAVAWVYSLFDELLQNFDSEYVNVNLDEPFELGQGKNRQLAAECGPHAPYLKHVHAMHRYCVWQNKRMMMWGDVLLSSPESIAEIPRDVTVLHWMYEGDGRFEPDAAALAKSGLDFVLCPGTSSWCSFTGRSDRMRANITDAVDCAIRYGAKGILLTDWGDLGHWQYISASYVPFAFGAALAWAGERQPENGIFAYCDRVLFGDATGQAARIFYEMGNYYRYEHAPLFSTTLCCGIMTAKHRFDTKESFPEAVDLMLALSRNLARGMEIEIADEAIHLDADGLRSFMMGLMQRVEGLQLGSSRGPLTKQEMLTAGRFVLHGLALYEAMTKHAGDEALLAQDMEVLFHDMDSLLAKHHMLWAKRNRPGGFAKSSEQLLHLMRLYDKYRA